MGYVLLEGGAEFRDRMASADRQAIGLAGGKTARIRIIPAAAVPDDNHERASANGVRWFSRLGALDVRALPLTDRNSANLPELCKELERANLIFLLGGFPAYLADTLKASRSWAAIVAGANRGSVIAGSSAGAMVLCQHFFDPTRKMVRRGLDLIPNTCLIPHHDTFGVKWVQRIEAQIPKSTVLGLDEETGVLMDRRQGAGYVYGAGSVTVYREGRSKTIAAGQHFQLH